MLAIYTFSRGHAGIPRFTPFHISLAYMQMKGLFSLLTHRLLHADFFDPPIITSRLFRHTALLHADFFDTPFCYMQTFSTHRFVTCRLTCDRYRDSTVNPRDSTENPRDSTKNPRDSTENPRDSTKNPRDSTKIFKDSTKNFKDRVKTPRGWVYK